ncbi:ribonuclease H-like domain-containing protein [Tanacetum coccineum]
MNAARPKSHFSKTTHSIVKRLIHKKTAFKNSNFNQRVNIVKDKNVNAARPKAVVNAARPKIVVNAVKGNNVNVVKASTCWVWKQKTKVLDHVSKHNSASITLRKFDYVDEQGKSKHMTGNMSYLTNSEEIDGGYVAFGGNPKGGKITGKVPRKNNMYSVDLKNIDPKEGLTCLFAKATSDESKLWHRRLATKDETSGILKSFITGIENRVDHKVKVIRYDNGIEFKNREMIQFCENKGILRQYSVARTPQQNGSAERRNKTLIEAARTMLADSKLPTTFWAEAVNTACYEVIINGDSPLPKRIVNGVEQTYPPTTAEEKLARNNDLKARGTLLMALPNEHQLKFNTYKSFKTLMEAIEKRLEVIKESKKTLRESDYSNEKVREFQWINLRKDLFKTYDRPQKLISPARDSARVLSLQTESNDDVVTIHLFANQSNSPQLDNEDLEQIDADDLEEMDLKWQMAMLTMRAKRFLNKTGMKISSSGSKTIRFNKSKVECYNCHKKDQFTRECRALRENRNREPVRRNVTVETTETNALVTQDGLGNDWSDQAEERPKNFALMAYTSSGAYKASLESIEARLDVYKKNEVVFEEDIKILKLDIMLRDNALTELRKKFEKAEKERDDLKLTLEKFENSSKNLSKLLEIQNMILPESITGVPAVATSKVNTSESKPKSVIEPLIEDWIFDNEYENETKFMSKQ